MLGIHGLVRLEYGSDTIEGTQKDIMGSRTSGSTKDELSDFAIGSTSVSEMILEFCDTAIAHSTMFGTKKVHTGSMGLVSIVLGVVTIEGFQASLDLSYGTTRSGKGSNSSGRECGSRGKGRKGIRVAFGDQGRCKQITSFNGSKIGLQIIFEFVILRKSIIGRIPILDFNRQGMTVGNGHGNLVFGKS
jgi:hypothetical protein